jgi:hypothetical protein
VGFEVYKSLSENGAYQKISGDIIPSQGSGDYTFVDNDVQAGRTYYYKLVTTDIYGTEREYGPVAAMVPLPEKFELSQNYPNPFNPETKIRYEIANREKVTLTIYNMVGQRVARLVDDIKEPGYYFVDWDGKDETGRDVATGIYIYRLVSGSQVLTRRMVKLK